MGDKKPPTLIIEVDLSHKRSYKKIQKILCCLQIPEGIKTISYDDKKNTVTISGSFDPDMLTKKLYKEACKVCLCIVIKKPPTPTPTPTPREPCKVVNCIKITVGGHKVDCPTVKCKEPPKPECPKKPDPCHKCCTTCCHVECHGGSCSGTCGGSCSGTCGGSWCGTCGGSWCGTCGGSCCGTCGGKC